MQHFELIAHYTGYNDPVSVFLPRGKNPQEKLGYEAQYRKLNKELVDLTTVEDSLDELIKDCAHQLYNLTDDKENARYLFAVKEVTVTCLLLIFTSFAHRLHRNMSISESESHKMRE